MKFFYNLSPSLCHAEPVCVRTRTGRFISASQFIYSLSLGGETKIKFLPLDGGG